jgi:hypothetical protein
MKVVSIVTVLALGSCFLAFALEEGLVLNSAGKLLPAGCASEKTVLDYTNLRTESFNCCNTRTCSSSSHSCCCGSTNPCCLLAVGSGFCCPDQCYSGTSPPVCCPGYACTAGHVCCDGDCCLPSSSPTASPTEEPTPVPPPVVPTISPAPSFAPSAAPPCCRFHRSGGGGGGGCVSGPLCGVYITRPSKDNRRCCNSSCCCPTTGVRTFAVR